MNWFFVIVARLLWWHMVPYNNLVAQKRGVWDFVMVFLKSAICAFDVVTLKTAAEFSCRSLVMLVGSAGGELQLIYWNQTELLLSDSLFSNTVWLPVLTVLGQHLLLSPLCILAVVGFVVLGQWECVRLLGDPMMGRLLLVNLLVRLPARVLEAWQGGAEMCRLLLVTWWADQACCWGGDVGIPSADLLAPHWAGQETFSIFFFSPWWEFKSKCFHLPALLFT